MDELIQLAKKAANSWRGTDAYHQAATLIDALCDRLERIMQPWGLTDADETGHEYECPYCKRHITTQFKGRDLPSTCPYCKLPVKQEVQDE